MKTAVSSKLVTKPVTSKLSRQMLMRQTPYMVTDLSIVQSKIHDFKRLLPTVDIYYAIKANNDPHIIKRINNDVAGYDVASLGELEYLVTRGISAERIMYSNPVKVPMHIARAYELGVRYFAFDSIAEIEKIATYAPGSNVYLRLKVSDYGSKFPLSKKFGVDIMHAVDYCSMAIDAGLNVVGVTFHVGSQSENVQTWSTAIQISGNVIKELAKKQITIDFLDLGGGFPADYGDPVPTLEQIAEVINTSVKKYLPAGIKLIAEPGRFVSANASTIVASVIGREHRSGNDWLYIDMGTFQGLIEPLEMPNLKYPITSDSNESGYKKSFILTGPSCDAYDTIGADYLLPSDIKVGDKLHISSVGAYSLVYASTFNGFQPPKVYHRG